MEKPWEATLQNPLHLLLWHIKDTFVPFSVSLCDAPSEGATSKWAPGGALLAAGTGQFSLLRSCFTLTHSQPVCCPCRALPPTYKRFAFPLGTLFQWNFPKSWFFTFWQLLYLLAVCVSSKLLRLFCGMRYLLCLGVAFRFKNVSLFWQWVLDSVMKCTHFSDLNNRRGCVLTAVSAVGLMRICWE